MTLSDDAEFEGAIDRMTELLENPPARGTAIDKELSELAEAVASYRSAEPELPPLVDSSPTRESAKRLLSRAHEVQGKYDALRGGGYGGLPLDGAGMGPTTGAP